MRKQAKIKRQTKLFGPKSHSEARDVTTTAKEEKRQRKNIIVVRTWRAATGAVILLDRQALVGIVHQIQQLQGEFPARGALGFSKRADGERGGVFLGHVLAMLAEAAGG